MRHIDVISEDEDILKVTIYVQKLFTYYTVQSNPFDKMTRLLHLIPLHITLCMLMLTCIGFQAASAEGSRQLEKTAGAQTKLSIGKDRVPNFATYTSDSSNRLFIRIASVTEKIYLGFGLAHHDVIGEDTVSTLYYRIKLPDGTIFKAGSLVPKKADEPGYIMNENQLIGPGGILSGTGGGYKPIIIDNLPVKGDYYIEFSQTNGPDFNIGGASETEEQLKRAVFKYFDITVGDGVTAKPGRLWSYTWQLLAPGEQVETRSEFFVYTKDSVVTRLGLNGMKPMGFTIMCNELGTNSSSLFGESRKSVSNQQAGYPEYKIFLNDPDLIEFPSYKKILALSSTVLNGCTEKGYCIGVKYNLNKKVKAEILLDFLPYGADPNDRTLTYTLEGGESCIPWDGKDNMGNPLPPSSKVQVTIKILTGLTNFPIYDAEQNPNGLVVELIRPQVSGTSLKDDLAPKPLDIFWDDSKIGGGTTNINTGCLAGGSGCHTWNSTMGNEATMNTWWNVFEAPPTFLVSNDQIPTIDAGPPQKICYSSGSGPMTTGVKIGTAAGSGDLSTDTYIWTVKRGAPNFEGDDNELRQPTVTLNNAVDTVFYEVTMTRNGCTAKDSTYVYKILNQGPSLIGFQSVCPGLGNVNYVAKDQLANNFTWEIIPASAGSIQTDYPDALRKGDSISVLWNNLLPGTLAEVKVTSNYNECGTLSSVFPVTFANTTVDPPVFTGDFIVCQSATDIHTFEAPYSPNYRYFWNTKGGTLIDGTGASQGLGKNVVRVTFPALRGAGGAPVDISLTITGNGGCATPGTRLYPVKVNPRPIFTGKSWDICSEEQKEISFAGTAQANTNYSWAPTFGLSAYNVPKPQAKFIATKLESFRYAVTATNQFNCSYTDVVTVNVYPKPISIDFKGENVLCEELIVPNQKHTFTLITEHAERPSWRLNGISDPSNIPVDSRTNSVEVILNTSKPINTLEYTLNSSHDKNNPQCVTRIKKEITFKKLIVYKPYGDETICVVPGEGRYKVFSNGGTTYDWIIENGNEISKSGDSIDVKWIAGNRPGPFKIAVFQTNSDNDECKSVPPIPKERHKLSVELVEFTTVTTTPKIDICLGDTLEIKGNTTPQGDPKYMSWKAIDAPADAPMPRGVDTYIYTPKQTTPVGTPAKIEFTFDNGCKQIQTTMVNINPVPEDPLVLTRMVYCSDNQESDTIVTKPDNPLNAKYTYLWDPLGDFEAATPDSSSIVVKKEQQYTLTVFNRFGCFKRDSIFVRDLCPPRIYVPKAITPDAERDETKNDVLKIFGANFINFKMRIFNRWGEVVYESTDRNESWDGTYNGQPVPFGVYPYVITYDSEFEKDNENPRQHTGSVTVIR